MVDQPIPMILLCPQCHRKHVDVGEWATTPHRTHLCEYCGTLFRPSHRSTVGVDDLGPKDPPKRRGSGVSSGDQDTISRPGPQSSVDPRKGCRDFAHLGESVSAKDSQGNWTLTTCSNCGQTL